MKRLGALGSPDFLLMNIGLLSTVYIFNQSFLLPHNCFILFMAFVLGFIFTLIYSSVYGKKRTVILLVITAIWSITAFLFRDILLNGATVFIGLISPYLQRLLRFQFAVMQEPDEKELWHLAIFAVYGLIPYIALFCRSLFYKKNGTAAILLTASVFAFVYTFSDLPGYLPLALLLLFWMTLILRPSPIAGEMNHSSSASFLCLMISGLFIGLLLLLFPIKEYDVSYTAYNIRNQIIDGVVNFEYSSLFKYLPKFTIFSGGTPLANNNGTVNLNQKNSLRYLDRDVLRIYSDQPEDLYLRGYAAGTYTGHAWLQTESTVYEAANIHHQPMEFSPRRQLDPIEIIVEPLDTDFEFMFTPYYFGGMAQEDNDAAWVNDAYLNGSDKKRYAMKSYLHLENSPYLEKEPNFFRFDVSDFISKSLNKKGSEETIYYLDGNSADAFMNDGNSVYPEYSIDYDYVLYITEEYTKLPEGLQENLFAWWAENGNTDDKDFSYYYFTGNGMIPYWQWTETAYEVAEQIKRSGTYTTSPNGQPFNQDFAAYFLNESNEGYCVHFATATTVMLRAFGIPARYVEGYVVNKEAFDADGYALVPAKNAHAWTEVWSPRKGWTVIDGTPGGANTDMAVEIVSAPHEREITDTPLAYDNFDEEQMMIEMLANKNNDEVNLPKQTDLPQEQEEATIAESSQGIFSTLQLLLLLSCTTIFAVHLFFVLQKKYFFGLKDKNKALLYIYGYLEKMADYGIDVPTSITELALKARYSSHLISDNEMNAVLNQYEKAHENIALWLTTKGKIVFWFRAI